MVSLNGAKEYSRVEAQIGARDIDCSRFGSAPVVLMLHGGGSGASGVSNYWRNFAALAEKFSQIIPDMADCGQSTQGLNGKDVLVSTVPDLD